MNADCSVGVNDGNSWSIDEDGDIESEITSGVEDVKANSSLGAEDGEGDLEENMDGVEGDYSDGWLLSEDDQKLVGENWLKTLDVQRVKTLNDPGMEMVMQSQAQHGPYIKTSTITGVGLQELLELINERLKLRMRC